MAAETAFTPVMASRTLTAKPVAAAASPRYNQGVAEYVQRAFFDFHKLKSQPAYAHITDADIRAKLAEVIHRATAEGTLDRDWQHTPLPHSLLMEERHKAALSVTQNSMLTNLNLATTPESASKKRKSVDAEPVGIDQENGSPPWKKVNSSTSSLADRITGKSKTQEKTRKDKNPFQGITIDSRPDALERRRQRFGLASPDSSVSHFPRNDVSPTASTGPIVGTCQTLEKNYFRLTAPPNPNTVRPLLVLEKALDFISAKWKQKHDYTYFCDQMKSMRQDLTVQRIKNEFTIKVYELHARIALEKRDLGEYNQCQTQLRALYKMKLGPNGSSGGHQDEFTAYRILYLIYTCNRTDMNNMLADLTPADKKGQFVQHALRVRAALASSNYHRFFNLYAESQDQRWNMVPYLMDMFVERERIAALAAMCKTYKPDISFEDLALTLAFDCDNGETFFSEDVVRRCLEFLHKHGADTLVVNKEDGTARFLTGKAGNTFEEARKKSFGKVDIKGQI